MLKYNDTNGCFILYTEDDQAARDAGLTLSTTLRGPNGEHAYFTADYNKDPLFNPYAVLGWYDQADTLAKSKLDGFADDYRESWADYVPGGFDCPEGKEFLPYQLAGIQYSLSRLHSIIADEPGLGKTIQAIGVANVINAQRTLVVCPASVRLHWTREIGAWSTLPKPSVWTVLKGNGDMKPDTNFVVISYNLLRNKKMHDFLRTKKWDLMILDEAHYLKSSDALRTRAVFGGGEKGSDFFENGMDLSAKRIIAMTGTPLPNRPRECYTLARGLNWESIDYDSYQAFLYRYNPSKFAGQRTEIHGRLPELNARLRCNLMVRRRKKDVLKQLPDKRYEMTYIEPDGKIREVLAREALIDFDPNDIFSPDFTLGGTPISTLRREMGEAMVPRVIEYLKYMLDVVEVPKLLLFAHHRSVLAALYEGMAKYNPVLHVGGMSSQAKDASVDTFKQNKHCRIFEGQLDTMEGVDGLQSICSTVVLAEPAWNPGRNEQVVDRAHRIGQHDNVVAHFLLVEDSFNEKVLNTVLSKAGDIHASLDKRLT